LNEANPEQGLELISVYADVRDRLYKCLLNVNTQQQSIELDWTELGLMALTESRRVIYAPSLRL